jgi:hypothetical protein
MFPGNFLGLKMLPKIFLSYASEDYQWVQNFVEAFNLGISGVKIQDYKAGDNLDFGELQQWVDQNLSQATGVIAFVSEYYQKKEWTIVRAGKSFRAAARLHVF